MKKNIAIIILAAGDSTRMNRSKQSLPFKNKTLLQRIVATATSLNYGPVIIVLGADTELISEEGKNIIYVINDDWREGMGSSICCGLEKLMEVFPSIEGAIITVCDQPYVTASLLQKMVDTQRRGLLPIIACSYGNTVGTPVFFHRDIFPELLHLKGDKGAKQIVNKDMGRVGLVDFPLGIVDIDTEEDYIQLLQKENDDFR